MLVHKGHLLLECFYLRKMIDLEVRPQTLEEIFYLGIPLRMDEVIGDGLSVGEAHLRYVFQEKKVLLGFRVLPSH
jgi:hypothetical protein